MLNTNRFCMIFNRTCPAEIELLFIRGLLTAILLLAFSFNAVAQSGAWVKKAQMPTPRGGESASVIKNKIYVIGGTNGQSDKETNEVFDPLTNRWEIRKSMPTPRAFLATAVINDTIYAIGGARPKVETYDPVTDTWSRRADMPEGVTEVQSGVVDGIIYLMCGAYKQGCWAYDPAKDKWAAKKPRPEFGGVIAVTVYNNLVYTFGGSKSPTGPVSSIVYAYDPKTDSWMKKKDMPTKKFSFRTYLVNNKIYSVGGTQNFATALSAFEVYDPVADTWEIKPDIPNPLTYFAGAVVNDKIYLIGGTQNWSTPKSDVWEYDPSINTNIKEETIKPEKFFLKQNYPNPFNPSTVISFSIPYPLHVTLKVFDLLGREVATLVNEEKPEGLHSAVWKADYISSGVYFYELRAGSFVEKRKMMLIR